jgi:hypothetical protein
MKDIIDIISKINSNYSIKKYIKKEWLKLLDEIITTKCDYSIKYKQLEKSKSIINLLEKIYNISNIDELDSHVVKEKKYLNTLVDINPILKSINDPIKKDILNKIYSNDFIPLKVIHWIETQADNYIKITFANITINIIDSANTDSNLIDHIINICRWLFAINSTPNKSLNLYIFLSPEQKIANEQCLKSSSNLENSCHLSRTNINSGASLYETWIQIFRKEEVLKVLIHELIHYLELDINSHSHIIDKECTHIHMHSDSNNILVNEAYTELLAIYLHTMYIAKIKYSDTFEEKFWELYMLEEKYTIYQINKIFRNYSIPNLYYFKNPNNFIQYTNVISYFIIKYLFFINTKYFLLFHNSKKNTVKIILYLLQKFYKLKISNINNIIDNSLKMSINHI